MSTKRELLHPPHGPAAVLTFKTLDFQRSLCLKVRHEPICQSSPTAALTINHNTEYKGAVHLIKERALPSRGVPLLLNETESRSLTFHQGLLSLRLYSTPPEPLSLPFLSPTVAFTLDVKGDNYHLLVLIGFPSETGPRWKTFLQAV